MFNVMNRSEAEIAISAAINAIEVEGVVDETLIINTKPLKGKVLLEVGREMDESSNIPSYRGIQKLDYTDNLVKLANKFLSLKEKTTEAKKAAS